MPGKSLSKTEKDKLSADFDAGYTDETECLEAISEVFDEYGYVLDTHTAVAYNVYKDFAQKTNNDSPVVIVSTASPYKFAHDVLFAIDDEAPEDAFRCAKLLFEISANPIPQQISGLKNKEKRFTKVIEKTETAQQVLEFIK